MATINLGRVGFVNKGTYSGSTAYKVNDVVVYNSGTYACIQANTGQAPTNTSYWQNWVEDNAVHKTGNETIAGVKTFSSSPIVPTPTADFQPVPLKSTNITVNVGAGQTYTTINQALEYLSGFYPMYKNGGITATINLKAGFVMAEQVLVTGLDLSWIKITGEDSITICNADSLTTPFYLEENAYAYPAFGVNRGRLPDIYQKFDMQSGWTGGQRHGILANLGSSAFVAPGNGFLNCGDVGAYAKSGSTITARDCFFSGARIGLFAFEGSSIDAAGTTANNCDWYGVYVNRASSVNFHEGTATGSAGDNVRVIRGSTLNCEKATLTNALGNTSSNPNPVYGRGIYSIASVVHATEVNVSGCKGEGIYAEGGLCSAGGANCSNAGTYGIFASRGSTINADGANCSNAGTYGIFASRGSTINAQGSNASNAGTYGILAGNGSTINAVSAIIQNQITGTARVSVINGSTIEAYGIDTTGGTVPELRQTANTLTGNGIIYQ